MLFLLFVFFYLVKAESVVAILFKKLGWWPGGELAASHVVVSGSIRGLPIFLSVVYLAAIFIPWIVIAARTELLRSIAFRWGNVLSQDLPSTAKQ